MTIEIGTSDFRTQAGQVEGIFIEPVKYYFDRLPDCNKINCAISNREGGRIDIYYLTDEEITRYNLPKWVRGCNSVGQPHPSVVKILIERCISEYIIRCDSVPVRRIKSILDEHNVTAIDFLKIDTEGHDCIILNDLLNTVDIIPKKIQFEANVLSSTTDVFEVRQRLFELGYSCQTVKEDIIATL